MRVVNIYPVLTDDELRRKQEEASRLFINVYQKHQQNKLAKLNKESEEVIIPAQGI